MVIGLTFLLGSAAAAQAGDYCIGVAGGTLALKAFSLPSKGTCKEARGFYISNGGFFTSGSACRSTDGSDVSFDLTTVGSAGSSFREIDSLVLHLPSEIGEGSFCVVDTGSAGGCSTHIIAHIPCSPTTVAVP
jgi:hypothetical protein